MAFHSNDPETPWPPVPDALKTFPEFLALMRILGEIYLPQLDNPQPLVASDDETTQPGHAEGEDPYQPGQFDGDLGSRPQAMIEQ